MNLMDAMSLSMSSTLSNLTQFLQSVILPDDDKVETERIMVDYAVSMSSKDTDSKGSIDRYLVM